jgi:DHA1 family tetracycline resistance protein-like MFS transporter
MKAATQSGPGRAAFAFVLVTVLLDMLALGVMVPVLPKLVVEFMGGDIASAATITGYFGFAWAAMQFVFSPVLGALSDRFGRRPVIILSNIGMGLDYVVMALAPSLWWLFIGRLLSGVSAATSATAGAYITDVTPPDKRAAKFGMMGAAFGFGFIIGPAVGGFLGGIDLRLPFWVAAGLSFANALYGFFVLPESLPRERRARFHWRMANPVGALKLLRTKPILIGLAAALFLERVAHDSLPRVFVLYTDYRYQWTAATVGLALAAVGVAQMIVSAGMVGASVRRFGERQTLLAGLLFAFAGFVLYGLAPTGLWFMAGVPLAALGGLSGPAMQGLMTREIGPSDQGKLQGALASIQGVAGLIGPLLFTQVFATAIRADGPFHLPGAPYLLSALLVIVALLTAMRATRARAPVPIGQSNA